MSTTFTTRNRAILVRSVVEILRNFSLAVLAVIALGLSGLPARADAGAPASSSSGSEIPYYRFKSLTSTNDASWCIEVPNSDYQNGKEVLIGSCTPCQTQANQTFGECNSNLTIGGYCLDVNPSGQNPAAGDEILIGECSKSDSQVWEVKAQANNSGYQINLANGNLCVTIDGNVQAGSKLLLQDCNDSNEQGWSLDVPSCSPGRAAEPGQSPKYCSACSESTRYYWYQGHRTCWYDDGFKGAGWYWCGASRTSSDCGCYVGGSG